MPKVKLPRGSTVDPFKAGDEQNINIKCSCGDHISILILENGRLDGYAKCRHCRQRIEFVTDA
jgi:hypothetical protein